MTKKARHPGANSREDSTSHSEEGKERELCPENSATAGSFAPLGSVVTKAESSRCKQLSTEEMST